MATKQSAPPSLEIIALSAAEIDRQLGELHRKRRAATQERAKLHADRKAGMPEPALLSDPARAARERAKQILNGHAPASLTALLPTATRDQELEIEVSAIDIVTGLLERAEMLASVAESAAFAEEHGAEWLAICREQLLAATRLEAAERRARAWRERLGPNGPVIPMGAYIGAGPSWLAVELGPPRAEALAERAVTAKELKEAENV